jgi:UDP-glucose 4-epimerase
MKSVVVTGGAGFIGSHLVRELASKGYRITILDDLSSGKMENIEELLTRPPNGTAIRFVHNSITRLPVLQELFQEVDYVFHLAAIASVPRSVHDPISSHEVNLTGTLNVLQAAKQNNVKKVVYISSSAVYGDTLILPQHEEMLPAPQSPYAVNKLAGEYYCKVFKEVYDLDTAGLRFFNIYGPRQDPKSDYAAVIPKFITSVLEGKPPVIFGTGEQTRDFVFVRDAVNATILAAESDATGIYNIGVGATITIDDLARLVIKVVGKDLEPVYRESRTGDILHSLSDISRARTFGYSPGFSLEEGLEETIRHYLGQVGSHEVLQSHG